MFKKFIKRILMAESQKEAWETVFYGENGIDMAYQKEKISWEDYDMLATLISKLK